MSVIGQDSAVDTPCLGGMVVTQDKKDVGALAFITPVLLLVLLSAFLLIPLLASLQVLLSGRLLSVWFDALDVCHCSGCQQAGKYQFIHKYISVAFPQM